MARNRDDDMGDSSVRGTSEPEFAAAVAAFENLFAGGRGGGALAVYHRGRRVVDVWTGTADAAGTRPWRENTAAVTYSTSKGITAAVVHTLAARGLIDYHAPVAEYWPEFGARGKRKITVAELLSHRAGLAEIGSLAGNLDELLDHHLMEERLAAARPDPLRMLPAYHAISFGWLAAGLARAVTGKGMAELYRTQLAEPLGITGLHLGAPPAAADTEVAESFGSATPFGLRNADQLLRTASRTPVVPGTGFIRSVYTSGVATMALGPEPALLRSEMPGANGVFTARAVAGVYDALATGTRLFSRRRIDAILRLQTPLPDRNLLLPMGWRLGYHSFPIPGAPKGFGHIGFVGSGGWADLDSGLAVGFVHNWLPEALRLPRDQFVLTRLLTPIVRAARARQDRIPSQLRPTA